MTQSLQILAIFVFTAVSAMAFWFAYDWAADDPEENDTFGNVLPETKDRYASLLSLDVGDPVVVRGFAAGDQERIVRPVAFADSRYLWVEGHKFSRYDGWLTGTRGLELDLSWIEPESADGPS